ncbi:DUF4373 domain-containing protein [Dysgonomonas capnocytophagoides]|uniref:DUF4373 domain-containing protein n=1 Tax=Dysgonomonas capnocytophagoides TaxID=45254 RepID=UPI00040FEFB8|nr:DUF4373 domain-containing protein [Dysgonomonas capnocytophagoides]
MARPLKQGIDYFSFDVDFFDDEKIEPISGEFGVKGEIIVIRLLCAVYRNGYFAMWNEQLKMTLANRCKVSSELIDQVVSRLVKWGFIEESLFNSDKIITSKGIQKRFQEATRKRKYNYSSFDYWLLEDKRSNTSAQNPIIGELFPPETPQSKVKESKEEKEIIKEKVTLLNGEEKIISKRLSPFLTEMLSDTYMIECLCMNNHLEPDILKNYIKQFFVLRSDENNQEIQVINDAQSYFSRWLRYEIEKENKHKPNEKPQKTGTAAGFKQFR